MTVTAYDPFITVERAAGLGIDLAPSLDDLLRQSDVVSLHIPHSAETHHLMNAERFAQMKRGAYLINTARGGLVDEAALINALERGHLKGAGLDVTDPEPPSPDNPLLNREDVVLTPHIASATPTSKDALWRVAIAQALQVLKGERPPHLVNPEVWPVKR
jgi:D-3-phosphoglycerate dehydrogenase